MALDRGVAGANGSHTPLMMVLLGMAGTGVLVVAGITFSVSGCVTALTRQKADASELAEIRKAVRDAGDVAARVNDIDTTVARRLSAWNKNLSDMSGDISGLTKDLTALRAEGGEARQAQDEKLRLIAGDLDRLSRQVAEANALAKAAADSSKGNGSAGPAANPDALRSASDRIARLESKLRELESEPRRDVKLNEEALKRTIDEIVKKQVDASIEEGIRKAFEDMRDRRRPRP